MNKHIVNSNPVKEYIVYTDLYDTPDKKYFDLQVRIALRNCGMIDPELIEEYESRGGYSALKKIISEDILPPPLLKK
jgi:NADH-quinone oxidoreductase subunit F